MARDHCRTVARIGGNPMACIVYKNGKRHVTHSHLSVFSFKLAVFTFCIIENQKLPFNNIKYVSNKTEKGQEVSAVRTFPNLFNTAVGST
jgi:hypothetical protein